MADDNTQQNKANQQLNAQNKPKKPENEREDYAKKMWQHIEKKTGSQTALSGLREGIYGNGENGEKKKKRRRRRRRGGGVAGHNVQASKEREILKQVQDDKKQVQDDKKRVQDDKKRVQDDKKQVQDDKRVQDDTGEGKGFLRSKNLQDQVRKDDVMVPFGKLRAGSAHHDITKDVSVPLPPVTPTPPVSKMPLPEMPFSQPPVTPISPVSENLGEENGFLQSKNLPINPFADVSSLPPNQYEQEKEIKEPVPPVETFSPFADFAPKKDADLTPVHGEKIDKKEPESFEEVQEKQSSSFKPPEEFKSEGNSSKIHKSESQEAYAEVVDITPIAESHNEQPQKSRQEFWEILEQAGLTKKRIFIMLGLIAAVVIGLISFALIGGDGGEKLPVESPVDSKINGVAGVESAYIFGLEYQPIEARPISSFGDIAGVEAAFALGSSQKNIKENFIADMQLLREMGNIFNTDIYALIDLSVDRRGTLQKHMDEMGDLIDEGRARLAQLDAELDVLDVRFSAIVEQKGLYEQQFFNEVDNLLGEDSYEDLQSFVALSQDAALVEAQFNSKRVVREKLISSLDVLIPRYEDIVSNQAALIKGVRVFDVEDSNIDAIVPLE